MNKIEQILATFEDYELAFLYRYKLDSYLEKTRDNIKKYIAGRGLDESRIDDLVRIYTGKTFGGDECKRCPRCKTTKVRVDQVEWYDTAHKYEIADEIAAMDGLSGKATYKELESCNVCGLLINDPNNEREKGLWQSVKDFFLD